MSAARRDGWWAAEANGCWTDGDAGLAVYAGPSSELTVRVVAGGPCRCETGGPAGAAALAG